MKPCSSKRKQIAWLAAGALAASDEAELCDHLKECAACARYLSQISSVTESLDQLSRLDEELPPNFHTRLAARVRCERKLSRFDFFAIWLRDRAMRIVLPIAAAAALVVLLNGPKPSTFSPRSEKPGPNKGLVQEDLDASLGNYRLAANQSPEKLDELLAAQAQRMPAPADAVNAFATLEWARLRDSVDAN